MKILCKKGGFHKYRHYFGYQDDSILLITCYRCVKCGKILGDNKYISDNAETNRQKYIDNLMNNPFKKR